MANIPLKSIKFPDLPDTYTIDSLSAEAKTALLACFQNVAWVNDNGKNYYDALYDALYPSASLSSISATYTQSGVVYETDSLDSLKADLIVTAHYDDSSTEVVSDYTLSGTLTGGTSTITVSYGGKTTTFTVVVKSITVNVDVSKLIIASNNRTPPNYYGSSTTRLSYPYFDVLVDAGATYKITAMSTEPNAYIAYQWFTQEALDAVNAGESFTGEVQDSGWQSNLDNTVQAPAKESTSQHTIVGVRFTFKKDSAGSTITDNFITSLTIKKEA